MNYTKTDHASGIVDETMERLSGGSKFADKGVDSFWVGDVETMHVNRGRCHLGQDFGFSSFT